jgi:hypothetical protein
MRYEGFVNNPDSVELSVSITMKLSEWKLVLRDLHRVSVPAMGFHNAVNDLIRDLSAKVESTNGGAE